MWRWVSWAFFFLLLQGQMHSLANNPLTNLSGFGWEYGNIAESLVRNGRFSDAMAPGSGPTAWMPPTLCWVYATVFAICGVRTLAAVVCLCTLKAACLSIAFSCLLRLTPRRGLVTLLSLLWVWLEQHRLFTELDDTWWINCLAVAALWSLLQLRQGHFNWKIGLIGCLIPLSSPALGLAYLTCTLTLALKSRGASPAAKVLLAAGAACSLWGCRNFLVLDHLYPVKSNLWFDFLEANEWDDDGILTDSFLMTMHPVNANPIKKRYLELGEVGFLEQARRQAAEIPSSRWLKRSLARLCNATLWLQREWDFYPAVGLHPRDILTLTEAGWLVRFKERTFWLYLYRPSGQVMQELDQLKLFDATAARSSRMESKQRFDSLQTSLRERLWRIFFTLLPTLCCCWLLIRKGPKDEGTLLAFLLYAGYLMPYVLIQHYCRYQVSVVGLQIYLAIKALPEVPEGRKEKARNLAGD